MTDPFTTLGLAADADAQAIKRSYARLLRAHRPDDDPTGFQELHAAYRAALQRAAASSAPRLRGSGTLPVAHATAARTRVEADAAPAAPAGEVFAWYRPPHPWSIEFDGATFLAGFRDACTKGDAGRLSKFLCEYPAFWHLPSKQAAGAYLLQALADNPVDMSDACFAATTRFFGYADALGDIDPLALRTLRMRCVAAWLVQPGNATALARHAFGDATPFQIKMARAAVVRAQGPFRWWVDLLHALRPDNFATQVAHVLKSLGNGDALAVPPPLDTRHASFWIDAATPGRSGARLLLHAARSVEALVLVPLLLFVIGTVFGIARGESGWLHTALVMAWTFFLATTAVVAAAWSAIGFDALCAAAYALSTRSRPLRVLLFSLTPALCIATVTVGLAVDAALGTLIAVGVLALTMWRSRRSSETAHLDLVDKFGLLFGSLLLVVPTIVVVKYADGTHATLIMLLNLAIVAVALLIWLADWRARGFLQPRA